MGSSEAIDVRNRFRVPYDFFVDVVGVIEGRRGGGKPLFEVGQPDAARADAARGRVPLLS